MAWQLNRSLEAQVLLQGRQIGVFRIHSLLGIGGMGEVWRATDTSLNRDVALKVLPDLCAQDPHRLARFKREAQLLASLNHPNIGAIYGLEESGPIRALVLELVEGLTLSDRLVTGLMPLEQTLRTALQIADAVGAAHDRGIVHRDLKPANIKLRPDGTIKVLDFGVAKAVDDAPIGEDVVQLTTITTPGATRAGVAVGTAAYMSPEQARGQTVDGRTDVWAFGCVLYEMLTGNAAFCAETPADTVAAVLKSDPDWSRLPPTTPPGIRHLLRQCLRKDTTRRLREISDARIEVQAALNSTDLGTGNRKHHSRRWSAKARAAVLLIPAMLFVVAGLRLLRSATGSVTLASEYQQITNFIDAAIAPSLSPDGRMIAFIRGGGFPWGPGSQVYIKLLPNGEPVPLTSDSQVKYAPLFTPDGTRIAYSQLTRSGSSVSWDTWTVPILGGPPTRFLPNASGLSWIDDRRVLFSEIKGTGLHMGLVTATEARADSRDVYFPSHERGMAHFSFVSPDGRSVLVIEMDRTTAWLPCRLVPFDGRDEGQPVGPSGRCTSAAWSPDGRWMYFGVNIDGSSHLWRQSFPDGKPEQITFGPTQEEGIALASDGRSLITSVGTEQNEIWIHDEAGERPLSAEGNTSFPRLSRHGNRVFFLVKRDLLARFGELRDVDLTSGRAETVLPGLPLTDYDISPDEQEVAFTRAGPDGELQIWVAPLDRRSPPRQVVRGGDKVSFGTKDELIFELLGGKQNFLYRINTDGSGNARITDRPILNKFDVSPDGEWVVAFTPIRNQDRAAETVGLETVAIRIRDGAEKRICGRFCGSNWSSDGRVFHVGFENASASSSGKTLAIPVPAGHSLPELPAAGIGATVDLAQFPGARVINVNVFPGASRSAYVFPKTHLQRNLYRIPLH